MHASLDQAEGMVSFVENPEQFDSAAIVQHMEGQLQRCVELQRKLAAFDKELTLDPRYVHKVGANIFKCQFNQLTQHHY